MKSERAILKQYGRIQKRCLRRAGIARERGVPNTDKIFAVLAGRLRYARDVADALRWDAVKRAAAEKEGEA